VQSLVTNTAGSGTFTAGQPVTVRLPAESLRVLATSPDHPVAYAETG